jgi:lipid-A-disaccharide synthase
MSNQLLSKPVVPELMQDDATADNIFKALNGYLENPERGLDLESEFRRIRGQLKLNANVQAAKAISELLNDRNG